MSTRIRETIQKLIELDQNLAKLKRSSKVKFIIFGGTAFLLETDHRFTRDIDIVLLERISTEQMDLLNRYQVNNNMQGVLHVPPLEEMRSRMRPLNVRFQCMEVYLPHPHDLIFSKLLGRADPRDIDDVIHSGILDKVNLEQLAEEYNDYVQYTLNPHRCPDIESIIQEYIAKKRK